ncbi:MAG TPA: EutN/CcmL family microcompartment protein [Polyangia bacterium]|nr:EutN/CcmL family microcompartment protein [Polyangia bacterium]
MILGRVVGHVWATRQDPRLGGAKLLVVRPHGVYEPALATGHLVAVDHVDAGVGDDVVVALGRPARLAADGQASAAGQPVDDNRPVDAAILGVVDRVELDAAASARPGAAPGIRRPLPALGGRA